MRRFAMLAIALASPAAADVVEVSDCHHLEKTGFMQFIECEVLNTSDTAVAEVSYGVRVGQRDRQVPWYEYGMDGDYTFVAKVRGGIEPGETVPVEFMTDQIHERADPDRLTIEVRIHEAMDLDGNPIE